MKKLFTILIMSIIFLSGCENKNAAIPTLAEPVSGEMDTAMVSRGDIYTLTTYDAKVYPDLQEVNFFINGTVKEVAVSLGQEVKKGDLLASLDDTNMKEQLTRLEQNLEDTKINNKYDNLQRDLDIQILELNIKQKEEANASVIDIAQMQADLEKLKIIRQQTVKMQEFDIGKTQEKLEELKLELEKTTIIAPCSGNVVYMKNLVLKGGVSADDPVIIIADASKLHVQSDFIELDLIKAASRIYALIKGKEYEIEYIPRTPQEIIDIRYNGAVIESSYSIKADSNVTSGDYACICIEGKFKANVLTIPKNALHNDSKGYFVYRIVDGISERCNVEIGTETDIQVEIISGLAEGDVIYVQG